MTQEQIIEQIEQSFKEHTGHNEAILDAAFYIEAEFIKLKQEYENKIKILEYKLVRE